MFKNNQLQILLKSLEYSISGLENYLEKYSEYLSIEDKKERFKELQEHKNMQLKIEWMIGNEEAETMLSENV